MDIRDSAGFWAVWAGTAVRVKYALARLSTHSLVLEPCPQWWHLEREMPCRLFLTRSVGVEMQAFAQRDVNTAQALWSQPLVLDK